MSPGAICIHIRKAWRCAGFAVALLALPGAILAAEPKKPEPAKPQPPSATEATNTKKKTPPVKASAPLSFNDDDLERYRHPRPPAGGDDDAVATEEEENEADGSGPLPGAAPTAADTPAAPGPRPTVGKPTAAAQRPATPRTPPPAPDPLKAMKDKNALEAFRQAQIEEMRTKIEGLQARLDYLRSKKNGLQNPAPIEVGRTVGPPKPDISPGHKNPPMGVFFPNLPPAQNDQDREDDKTLKPQALLDKIGEETKTVESDLEQAKRDLIAIETRFALESTSR